MKKIRPLKFLFILLLLGCVNVSQAHVYWKPNSGNDSNDGSTAAKAVKTWSRAKALIASTPDNWIVLCETCSNITLDGYLSSTKNAKIIRNPGWGGTMFSGTVTTSNVTIDGRYLNGNTPPDCISIIASGNTITINAGTVIQNNHSTQFGAIWIYNGGTFVMNGGTIKDCDAVEGGAIFSGASNTFYIHGGTIKDCSASQNGGAIALRSGSYTLTIDGGTIENCSSPWGGAVYVAPILKSDGTYSNVNATINMSGGTIRNCTATATNNVGGGAGGGMYLGSTTGTITMNMTGGTIDGCSASNYGGAIALQRGTFNYTMSNGTIQNCNAIYGGGIFVNPVTVNGELTQIKTTMLISGGLFEHCTATNEPGSGSQGGGIYMRNTVEGSTLTMTGGKFHNCISYTHGGGIYVRDATTVTHLTGGEIYECTCAGVLDGDGIGRGGGVAFQYYTTAYIDGDNMLIHDNVCKHYGGGVQVDSYSTLYFSKGKVYNNTAGYVEPDMVSCGAAGLHITQATLYMSGGYVYGNATRGVGGGLHASYEGTMEITGGEFYDNIAEQQGGGLNLNTQCHLTFPRGSTAKFYDNEAGIGGAILLDGANLTIYDGEFYGNQALDTYPTHIFDAGAGGAFCLVMDRGDSHHNDSVFPANFYMYGGNVHDNYASNHGGGLFVSKNTEHPLMGVSHITIKGGEMHENEAHTGCGGGIYADAGCIFLMSADTVMDGSSISAINTASIYENTAAQSGGGVYLTDAKFTVESGSFLNNTADRNGGGFYIAGDTAQVAVKGGEIKFNRAGQSGGGFAVVGGTVDISQASTAYPTIITSDTAYVNGGGMCVTGGVVTLTGGSICDNEARQHGGGFYVDPGTGITTTINSATAATHIDRNKAASGGAVYSASGNVSITNASISYNTSTQSHGGAFTVADGNLYVTDSDIDHNRAPQGDGGGAYVSGTGEVKFSSGTAFTYNAAIDGGAISVAGGNLTLDASTIAYDTAYVSGGGIHVTKTVSGGGVSLGSVTLQNGAVVKRNEAGESGGGIYVAAGGSFTMTDGTIGGTVAEGNYTTGTGSQGGGLYMGGGTADIKGGRISGNRTYTGGTSNATAGKGGGIYMAGGTCTLSNGATIGGADDSYANSADQGGGIHSVGGTITVKGGKLQRNTALLAGGAIYTNGAEGVVNMEKQSSKAEALSYIEYNTAPEGGGIYANLGEVNFSDGYIQYNFASEAGGGIYVNAASDSEYGKLYLRGSANLYRNHVPEGHNGGGVYLKGVVQIGEQLSDPIQLGTIRVQENYAGDEYLYDAETIDGVYDTINHLTANTRNNIYLPAPDTVHSDNMTRPHRDVITLVEDGIDIATTRVGFSVPHGNVPVIYCDYSPTSRAYLHQFSTGRANQYAVFDDTRRYIAVQYSDQPELFDPDHVYLYGFWSNEVTGSEDDEYCYVDPETFDPMNIATPCELAFFISYVNGLNNQTAHPAADGKLVADIDMSEFGWVPIGHLTQGYKGHFDGNGHTVTGIVSLLNTEYVDYGFFGNLNGGTVENLFIKDAKYSIEMRDDNSKVYIGGIAGHSNNGTIENCEVQSIMYAEDSRTIMGGVIGLMATGTVHSVCAMPTMTGNLMGGLVGKLNKGNLQNSFANGKFNIESTEYYSGGLVGQCSSGSLVENCYARLLGVAGPTDKFGIFVGDNNGGTVRYCYAPTGYTNYTIAGNDPTGHGNYAVSELPYLYAHRDTQVTLVAGEDNVYVPEGDDVDKQMLVALNRWVDTINSTQSAITYTKWGRPWQESETLKFVNDDYPVLKMPVAEAIGGQQDDPYLYYNCIDPLLTNFTEADQSIWLYRTPTDTVRGDNANSNAKLYIDEEVALINENALKAYVGITLDNSAGAAGANPTYFQEIHDATDWHMISTPLSNAPLGINYDPDPSTDYAFDYLHPTGMPYYRFYPKTDAKHGYFPSHRYGTTYTTAYDSPTGGGNYYREWDFYSYYEPEYHWINFKRNSNSHHHMDGWHFHIGYTNESSLTPGKGYFAATREETFLQCQGNLNNTNVTYGLTKTDGVPRHGYNLLGNPYQAYLDFDKFAEANAGSVANPIWSDLRKAGYTILDEDNPQVFAGHDHQDSLVFYRTYAYGSSDNEGVNPGRFIHQHQGFFVLLEDNATATAKFNLDQRNASDTVSSSFRGEEHLNYPLVNLFATEANGNTDVVTVELGRPEAGGAPVMAGMRMGNAKIWCHYEDADYTIAFTQPGLTEANIRFETVEDTEYTMRWNTRNGDFNYLHLIDNMTGADVNCLTTDEYRFSARTSDYKSRFRLVFGYTGMEENVEGDSQQGNFAFMMGDELVVTGEGSLQVFDVSGRLLVSRELRDVQTTIQLPQVANGVYMLRLTDGKQTRVQKMVISK